MKNPASSHDEMLQENEEFGVMRAVLLDNNVQLCLDKAVASLAVVLTLEFHSL